MTAADAAEAAASAATVAALPRGEKLSLLLLPSRPLDLVVAAPAPAPAPAATTAATTAAGAGALLARRPVRVTTFADLDHVHPPARPSAAASAAAAAAATTASTTAASTPGTTAAPTAGSRPKHKVARGGGGGGGAGHKPSRPAAHERERASKGRSAFGGLRRGFLTPEKVRRGRAALAAPPSPPSPGASPLGLSGSPPASPQPQPPQPLPGPPNASGDAGSGLGGSGQGASPKGMLEVGNWEMCGVAGSGGGGAEVSQSAAALARLGARGVLAPLGDTAKPPEADGETLAPSGTGAAASAGPIQSEPRCLMCSRRLRPWDLALGPCKCGEWTTNCDPPSPAAGAELAPAGSLLVFFF